MVKIINHSKEKIEQKRKEIEKEIEQNNKSIIKHNFVVVNISIAKNLAKDVGEGVADKFNIGKTIDKIWKLGDNFKSTKSSFGGLRANYSRGYNY